MPSAEWDNLIMRVNEKVRICTLCRFLLARVAVRPPKSLC